MKKFLALVLSLCLVLSLAACGSSNSEIELTIPELEQCSNSLAWVDVCKGWQVENA